MAAALAFLLPGVAACTTNPATGEQTFTAFMSRDAEIQTGREEHPKILRQFGGEYKDPALSRYVTSLGTLLAQTTETRDQIYTFTILNSDIVNAMALPGGYVYVTRGLLALAENEAELAGVMAHEIGHVVARHTAERYSQAVLAQLATSVLGVAAGNQQLGNLAGLGAQLYLLKYSREQEFEADLLGVRYMRRAGFDPNAMASFLSTLSRHGTLEAQIAGQQGAAEGSDFFATHPRTADRVYQAMEAANVVATPKNPVVARDIYLDKIDGLLYGDDPEQGIVDGRVFAHPGLGFRFKVPESYNLINTASQVVALGPDGGRLVFDQAPKPVDGPMTYYLERYWPGEAQLSEVERITVNGLDAATGYTQATLEREKVIARFVAIRWDVQTIYRFLFILPENTPAGMEEAFRRTTYSFRSLTAAEKRAIRPKRLAIVTVKPGEDVASFAARMPYETLREERFRTLNALEPDARLRPGMRVKLVVQ